MAKAGGPKKTVKDLRNGCAKLKAAAMGGSCCWGAEDGPHGNTKAHCEKAGTPWEKVEQGCKAEKGCDWHCPKFDLDPGPLPDTTNMGGPGPKTTFSKKIRNVQQYF